MCMSVQNHKKEITLVLVLQSSTLVAKTSSIDHRGGSPELYIHQQYHY